MRDTLGQALALISDYRRYHDLDNPHLTCSCRLCKEATMLRYKIRELMINYKEDESENNNNPSDHQCAACEGLSCACTTPTVPSA